MSAIARGVRDRRLESAEIESAAGVSALTAATGQLLRTSLQYSRFGNPLIGYARGQANDGNYLLWYDQNGILSALPEGLGVNGSLTGAPALNFAIAGWDLASTLNEVGDVITAYVGPGNWLYSNSCGD